MGALGISRVSECSYYIGTGTNNTTGIVIKQNSDGALTGTNTSHAFTPADGLANITAGQEKYGYRLTVGDHYFVGEHQGTDVTSMFDSGINSSELPVAHTDEAYDTILQNFTYRMKVTHYASMSGNTPADSYKQRVIYTAYTK